MKAVGDLNALSTCEEEILVERRVIGGKNF
jgi:hypothetical protein